jgi:KamA family protein
MFDNQDTTRADARPAPLVSASHGGRAASRYRVFTARDLDTIPELDAVDEQTRFEMKVVAGVLPFRANEYVVRELIDWSRVPDDPIFQLIFPQRQMLATGDFDRMADLVRAGASADEKAPLVRELREKLNPHPAGQMEMNVPREDDGMVFDGLQHKYRETVLFFPKNGQVCHAYCTFCFRWAQFVGERDFRMAAASSRSLFEYLRKHTEVTDLLMTGGDPMVMNTANLRAHLEPLTGPQFDHIRTVRIGTKALTFWPQRFVTDRDADGLLRLLERLVAAGKHVAIMAHYNHWREMDTDVARQAIRRLRRTGAQIRSQGPLLAHINDNADDWIRLWQTQVRLGIVPYYMFVERDTGARNYFEVPLVKAWRIYREAVQRVSGLARTARGPSMSAGPGKVEVQGVTEINGEKVFVLRFIQGRNPDWVQRPFFAKYDEKATWLDQLQPWGADEFFFEPEYRSMCARAETFLEGKKLV